MCGALLVTALFLCAVCGTFAQRVEYVAGGKRAFTAPGCVKQRPQTKAGLELWRGEQRSCVLMKNSVSAINRVQLPSALPRTSSTCGQGSGASSNEPQRKEATVSHDSL